MKYRIEINCDNEAFGTTHAETVVEVARILSSLARKLPEPYEPINLYDINGNKVGRALWKKER